MSTDERVFGVVTVAETSTEAEDVEGQMALSCAVLLSQEASLPPPGD